MSRAFSSLTFPLLCLFFTGCGSEASKAPTANCHPAKGTVTVAGKSPVGAQLILVPQKADDARPRATVGEGGAFTLSTFGTDDGAPAGEYGLILFWPGNDSDDQFNGRFSTPAKSKQTITIKDGANTIPPIQLK